MGSRKPTVVTGMPASSHRACWRSSMSMRCAGENSPTKLEPHAAATRISASLAPCVFARSTVPSHESISCCCERLKLRRTNMSHRWALRTGREVSMVRGGE